MPISVFDMFSIGIGPSSSHTVGPMRAARDFALRLEAAQQLSAVAELQVDLYGSLGLTGLGHGTDRAVIAGLEGWSPDQVNPAALRQRTAEICTQKIIRLLDRHLCAFDPAAQLRFIKDEQLPQHANGLRFTALDEKGLELLKRVYYSVGGGFVVDEAGEALCRAALDYSAMPFSFKSAAELIAHCDAQRCGIKDILWQNECALRPADEVRGRLMQIWAAMRACIDAGLRGEGTLPGLQLKRRAAKLYAALQQRAAAGTSDPLQLLDVLSVYAIAVGEENASGGRVVTAPTNGAAGIIPAVLRYYVDHIPAATEQGIVDFLLSAAAIGMLYKEGASLSGAEVGCQGEIGVAGSMAAGALAAVLGGSSKQIENAAEIAMEHTLGLTCDPVGGYVQIPCIERNAIGAVKAVNAARLALLADGVHMVSLDKVIAAMKKTGADMSVKYKETSLGGLATTVGLAEC